MSQTWVFRSTATGEADTSFSETSIGFTSNGETFDAITIDDVGYAYMLLYKRTGTGDTAAATLDYSNDETVFAFAAEAYKTVVFDTAPTGDLLTWLQANADKTADTDDSGSSDDPVVIGGTMFLVIDGVEIEDLEEGDYTAYEEELGVSERMISGRRIEEIRATIWHVEISSSAISAEKMAVLNAKFQASRRHQLFFLPSTGGTELISGWFHLTERPQPALERWWDDGPVWTDYTLHFEEIDGHDPA